MKLQYVCLDSALDLWPSAHFELGVFATPIGRSEMECAALGFSWLSSGFLEERAEFCQFCREMNILSYYHHD